MQSINQSQLLEESWTDGRTDPGVRAADKVSHWRVISNSDTFLSSYVEVKAEWIWFNTMCRCAGADAAGLVLDRVFMCLGTEWELRLALALHSGGHMYNFLDF